MHPGPRPGNAGPLEPRHAEQQVLSRRQGTYAGFPLLERTAGGRLAAAWLMNEAGLRDHYGLYEWRVQVSADAGRTWTAVRGGRPRRPLHLARQLTPGALRPLRRRGPGRQAGGGRRRGLGGLAGAYAGGEAAGRPALWPHPSGDPGQPSWWPATAVHPVLGRRRPHLAAPGVGAPRRARACSASRAPPSWRTAPSSAPLYEHPRIEASTAGTPSCARPTAAPPGAPAGRRVGAVRERGGADRDQAGARPGADPPGRSPAT